MTDTAPLDHRIEDLFSSLGDATPTESGVPEGGSLEELRQQLGQRVVFRALVEHASGAIALARPDGRLTFTNRSWRALFAGSDEARSAGETSFTTLCAVPSGEGAEEWTDTAEILRLAYQRGWSGQVICRRADGSSFSARLVAFPILGPEKRPMTLALSLREESESSSDIGPARDIGVGATLRGATGDQAAHSQRLPRRWAETVLMIADRAAQAADEVGFARELASQIRDQLQYDRVLVFQQQRDNDALELIASAGALTSELTETTRIALGQGSAGQAAVSGQAVLVSDVPRRATEELPLASSDTRCELAIPVRVSDTQRHIVVVQATRPGQIDEQDQLILLGLAGQVAAQELPWTLQPERPPVSNLHRTADRARSTDAQSQEAATSSVAQPPAPAPAARASDGRSQPRSSRRRLLLVAGLVLISLLATFVALASADRVNLLAHGTPPSPSASEAPAGSVSNPSPTETDLPTPTATLAAILGVESTSSPAPAVTDTPTLEPTSTATPAPSSTPSPPPTATPDDHAVVVPTRFAVPGPAAVTLSNTLVSVPRPVDPVPIAADAINIVILGSDKREDWTEWHTDAVHVVSIQPSRGVVSVLSIPRDLYVYIPGHWMSRINFADFYGDDHAYDGGGPALLRDTLLYNLGIRMDHYARTDFSGLINIVDTLDGIDVPVHCQLRDYWPYPNEDGTYDILTIEPGIHHFDGRTALWYARSRKTTSVFSREWRQQQVLQAIWRRFRDTSTLADIPALWSQGMSMVITDLTLSDMLNLAPLALNMEAQSIRFYNIGADEVTPWTTPYGGHVYLPQWDRIQPIVAEMMAPVPSTRLEQSYRTIEVWNGTDNPDWDALAADRIYRAGFTAQLGTPDQRDYEQTRLIVFATQTKGTGVDQLQAVFGLRPQQVRLEEPDADTVGFRLILGSDYQPCYLR